MASGDGPAAVMVRCRIQNIAKPLQECQIQLTNKLIIGRQSHKYWDLKLFAKKSYNEKYNMRLDDLDFQKWKDALTGREFELEFVASEDVLEGKSARNDSWRPLDFNNEKEWRRIIEDGVIYDTYGYIFPFRITSAENLAPPLNSGPSTSMRSGIPDEDSGPDDDDNYNGIYGSDEEDADFVGNEQETLEEDEVDAEQEIMHQWANRLRDSKVCEHFSQEMWECCCDFFGIEVTDEDPKSKVNFANMERGLFHYQAYAIYLMMWRQRRSAGGGFLGDEQGLGKTAVGLGYCIAEHLLAEAWTEVNEDRRSPDSLVRSRHNSIEQSPTATSCPSETYGYKPFAFPCPCFQGSLTSKFFPHYGPSLVVAPPGLLSIWKEEFEKMSKLRDGNYLNMEFFTLHANGDYAKADAQEQARIRGLFADPVVNGRSRPRMTKYIIATSSQSWDTQFDVPYLQDVFWARIVRDEFHLMKGVRTNAIKQLKSLKGQPFLWALSGTPFETSPADLDGYLDVLRSQCEKDWKYPPYSLATKTEFRKIINDHKEIVANGQAGTKTSPDLIQRMTEKFQQVLVGFMIRRTTETKWFRQNIVDLPPDTFTNEPKVKIPARFKPSFKILRSRAQRKMDRDLKKRKAKQKSSQTNAKPAAKKFESASRILRMAETIPALAEIVLEREKNNEKRWELTARELKDKKWYEANDSLYNTYLLRLSNSPKLRLLERSVLKILAKDKLGRDEKVIVFSSFPAIAFIVHLWLQSKNYNSILIHANTKERTELLQGFQEALSAADDDDKPKQKKSAAYRKGENATILVSTPDLIGTGYTLTRAFRAVLMEPAWLKASEKQAFSRVRRIGQENDTFTYRLECDDKDSIEQKIITRQTTRGNIANLCFGDVKDPDAFDQNELKRDKSYNNPMFDDSDTDENRARIQYRKAEAKAGKIAAPRKKAAAKTVKKTTTKTPAKKAAPKKAPKKAAAKNPVKRAGKRKQDGDDDDDGPPPKKRKRRTKAQIAEDKAAGKVAAAKTAVKQEKYLRNFSDDEA